MEISSNKFRDSAFIFSTSEISEENHPKDSLYMWSHYGNGHRGVAIEFDTILLAKAVLEAHKKLGASEIDIDNLWMEIKYLNEIPKITCEDIFKFVIRDIPIIRKSGEKTWLKTELADIIRKRSTSKSIGWIIERELRLMWQNDQTRLKVQRLDLLDDTITSVYLGFRYSLIDDYMNDDLIFETIRNFPRAEIFKGRKGRAKSVLDFERIAIPDAERLK